jgi:RHS repeat-associated protein
LDTLNRPRWIARPATGDTTRFQYDLLNNLRSVTDAKNQVYTYQVNALGWVTAAVSPGASIGDTTRYDVAGNPTYIRTRAGRRDSLVYDALGRVTKKFGLGEGDAITYTYAPNLRWVKALKMSGATFVSMDSIATDSVGRKIQESAYRPSGSFLQQYSFQADKPDRTFASLNDGGLAYRSIQYAYDAEKRLSQIEVVAGGISAFGYDSENLPTTVQFPSGLTQTTSYTSSHALARRQYSLQAVKDSFDRSYRTDSLARVVERADGNGTKYQTFMYNLNNRLATWEKRHKTGTITCGSLGDWGYNCSGISIADQSAGFNYDAVGNPTDAGATLDPGNRLRNFNGVSMLYDADGNLVRRIIGTTTDSLLWDDFGQLKEVRRSGTTIATFAYDGFGRRTRKTAGGTTTQYIWDGDQLRAEANGADTTTQTYSYYPGLDQLHAVTKNGVTYYASIEPATGDVIGLINGSTNAVVATYNYTPWGEIESSTQTVSGLNSLRWKGLLYDSETGLYYMRARYYDPKTRRFISEDPVGLAGGINPYAFADNDPTNKSDPSGLDACSKELEAEGWHTVTFDEGGTWCYMPNAGQELPGVTVYGWNPDWYQPFGVMRTPSSGVPNSWNYYPSRNGGTFRGIGPNGRAKVDIDFGHDYEGKGDPHAHDWDWSKPTDNRGPARAIRPDELQSPWTPPPPAFWEVLTSLLKLPMMIMVAPQVPCQARYSPSCNGA